MAAIASWPAVLPAVVIVVVVMITVMIVIMVVTAAVAAAVIPIVIPVVIVFMFVSHMIHVLFVLRTRALHLATLFVHPVLWNVYIVVPAF